MMTRRTPIMGDGPGEKPLFSGLESQAIAHNELVASARFVTFDVPERDFPGNRSPACWKFVCRPKGKNTRAAKGCSSLEGVYDDVEALIGRGRQVVARELRELRVGHVELVRPRGIAFTQALQAD